MGEVGPGNKIDAWDRIYISLIFKSQFSTPDIRKLRCIYLGSTKKVRKAFKTKLMLLDDKLFTVEEEELRELVAEHFDFKDWYKD